MASETLDSSNSEVPNSITENGHLPQNSEITEETNSTENGTNQQDQPNESRPENETSQTPAPDASPEKSKKPNGGGSTDIDILRKLIKEELNTMAKDPEVLRSYGDAVNDQLEAANRDLAKLEKLLGTGSWSRDEDRERLRKELRELKKRVTKLKAKFPSKVKIHKLEKDAKSPTDESNKASQIDSLVGEKTNQMFSLHSSKKFSNSEIYMNFESLYHGIEKTVEKLCLLSFSVFPENAQIRRSVLINWWIAEGFITEEKEGSKFLKKFTEKGFIQPIFKKPGSEPHGYEVHDLARVVLISMAKKASFFDFAEGYPTEGYAESLRACLVGEGLVDSSNLEKIHMIFNLNETTVDFKPEWFEKMENINILHLGRWQCDERHHIEIEDPEILEQLQHLKFLRFLSLQGISRVTELPDSIRHLGNLKILDIRACHNLEVIPSGIGSLHNLTHLDMSDCYLIDHLPKEIANLKNLEVLKGFIIVGGDSKDQKKVKKKSCNLKDLSHLKNLKKLGIYTSVAIPNDDVKALQDFRKLQSLSISWGSPPKDAVTIKAAGVAAKDPVDTKASKPAPARTATIKAAGDPKDPPESKAPKPAPAQTATTKKPEDKFQKSATLKRTLTRTVTLGFGGRRGRQDDQSPSLPLSLEKLELNCYPDFRAPEWLKPQELVNLKKLYIRGGNLRDLGAVYDWDEEGPRLTKNTWRLKILRLKYLGFMEMRWREFRYLFPNLELLEKVECPKLTLFPCNGSGVWMNNNKK